MVPVEGAHPRSSFDSSLPPALRIPCESIVAFHQGYSRFESAVPIASSLVPRSCMLNVFTPFLNRRKISPVRNRDSDFFSGAFNPKKSILFAR